MQYSNYFVMSDINVTTHFIVPPLTGSLYTVNEGMIILGGMLCH